MRIRKTGFPLLVGLVLTISFLCFSKALASENDEAIKTVFKDFETAYNDKDAKTAVAVFHPDARIKSGQSYYSRQEYETRLPDRIEKFGPLKYESFEISIKENKATVEAIILFTKSGKSMKMKYSLVLDGGKWMIVDQDF